ncbi:hypothetical protein [Halodesulfovibrio marinisediminis]|uniref:Uncharacterized protein n=1 Tax=Halodesulfovibrio marinisediminis DSM 17456 TaxID=1121457 RepID=A0A1N6IHE3_9BACT|nr:hypothetical protein [Halodesulfovibrio marinisediminis]SIO31395.1 hypothetical protein SAMN02745161_2756 [Halodesulfovibrio marinisediminis DSM 17456]
MKRLLVAIMLAVMCTTSAYAEDEVVAVEQDNTIKMQDLIGKTILYTWQAGPFKGASHKLLVVDPNTMQLSVESGMEVADPITIKCDVVQISDQVFYLTWRSEEYDQTLVLTFNFETNMIYEVVVSEKTNYLSKGPFTINN